MRIRYLIRFEKKGCLKFIGHLDLIKLMQRCVKLSGIDIDYSKGFNPRQLVSVALPLSVGTEGFSEYAVFEMKSEINERDICERVNAVMPEGLSITGCRSMPETEKNPASLIRAAEYTINLPYAEELDKYTAEILKSSTLKLEKPVKYKKGRGNKVYGSGLTETIDIRSGIYDIKPCGERCVNMLIAQGSADNLKPELVIKCLCAKMNIDYIPHKNTYIRKELYKQVENGSFISLFS